MSTLLEVFGKKGYAQHRLPLLKNTDYSFWLSPWEFRTAEPLRISLEIVDDVWYILSSDLYFPEDAWEGRRRLLHGGSFDVITAYGDRYTFVVSEIPSGICPFGKFFTKDHISIGRSHDNDIILLDKKGISRNHADITRTGDGWMIASRSINGVYVNDEFTESSRELHFGDHINIMGIRLVFFSDYIAVEESDTGVLVRLERAGEAVDGNCGDDMGCPEYREISLLHRSPRSLREIDASPIVIDAPPEKTEREAASAVLSVFTNLLMMIPMAGSTLFMIYAARRTGEGFGFYMYSGLVMCGLSLVTGIVWNVVQECHDRKRTAELWRRHSAAYRGYLMEKEEDIRSRHKETRERLEERYVHAMPGRGLFSSPETLWTRAPSHSDFLVCRLGLGQRKLPAEIKVPDDHFRLCDNPLVKEMYGLKERYADMETVPMVISLERCRKIGLAARDEEDRISLARNMMIQFALSNCYTETKIGLIYDAEGSCYSKQWDFLRWLPHVWSENRDFRLLASNREEAGALFYRLLPVIRKREESDKEDLPVYILFIEASKHLEGEPIERYLTDGDKDYGIIVVWLASERDLLPHSCEFVVEKNNDFQGYYPLLHGDRTRVAFDQVSEEAADELSRSLSFYRVLENKENNEIPMKVTFLQMLGVESVEELDIRSFWKKNRTLDSLRVPVGLKSGGRKKYLDIHEKYHGPHGLVAGTTGSGKSELLQSYILSLLILYSPEAVNLFLIDYKGGGMSGMFDGLPHLCGQISNLSGSSIYRAMVALKSENQRRQRIFARYHVNSITDYMKLYYERDDMEPMPHLLIVIDEFAELKKEEPDFMERLISVAQVGRSLGLHLILATQKPGGVVDDKIWSNARFRMCLRVQEKQDSMDMLHKPDAADPMQTGRCCFQVGNDEIYEVFQSGWSGAPYVGKDSTTRGKSARRLCLSGEEDVVHLRSGDRPDSGETEFQAVKRHIMEMAAREGYQGARQLWMEPLEERIFLEDITGGDDGEDGDTGRFVYPDESVCIGLADNPANQSRLPVFLRISVHSVICGLPASGKSTFLQTALYAIVSRFTPREVQIYALDYSSGACRSFEAMPHVGAVITGDQDQRCQTLFVMLERMLEERRALFAGANYLQYVRTAKDASVPRIILLIDNFSSFQEKTEHRYYEDLLRLCREGVNAGITLMISCGGFSASELPSQLSEYFADAFCLEMKEKFSYVEVLGSINIPVIPDKGIRGRGLVRIGEEFLEFQTALAVRSDDDYDRLRRIRQEAEGRRESYTGPEAAPVRSIPEKASCDDLIREDGVDELLAEDRIPIGYNQQTAELESVSLRDMYCFTAAGRKRGGKHQFMSLFLRMLKRKKEGRKGGPISINIIDFSSRFASEREDPLVDRYISDPDKLEDFLEGLARVFQERKKDRHSRKEPRYIILIEDLTQLFLADEDSERGFDSYLENVWSRGAGLGVFFAGLIEEEDSMEVCGREARQEFIRHGTGIHLGGNLTDDFIFEHEGVPFHEQTRTLKPGNGYFFSGQEHPVKILIPRMEGKDSYSQDGG